jgi:predicted NBD/HSP70 family sugar kinase
VTVVAGTGVGAGIVVDGRLLRGSHAVAGELGHVRVAEPGRACSCGGAGCLEAMANGAALVDYAGGGFADAAGVFVAADGGDAEAVAAVRELAGFLAAGVAVAASVLDPERIVLAGGVGSHPSLAPLVRASAAQRCIAPLGEYLDVRTAALGADAGLVGAGILAEREHA